MDNYDDLLSNTPTRDADAPQLSKEEYAAKKKAERDAVFALSDDTAYDVAADGGKLRSFLDLQARLYRYSAANALLVFARNPGASRLGDFDYWKERNCSVKPKQTGIAILEPHEYMRDDNTPGTGYDIKKVFDISQVDTRRLRTEPPVRYDERQLLGALVSKAPVAVTGAEGLPDGLAAMSDPETGDVLVLKGMGFDDTFRAVAQELALAGLAASGRTQADPRFSAHCAAYLLCRKYGADTQAFSFDGAPGVFEGMDAQGIRGELSQVRDVAEDVSSRMARQLEAPQKAARSQDAR